MVHHPWIELFRARRSMRVLTTQPAAPAGAAAAPAAAPCAAPPSPGAAPASARALGEAAPKAPKALLHALTQKQLGAVTPLQRVEDMLSCDDAVRSAASSPCLGARPLPVAAGVGTGGAAAGLGAITAIGQLSRMADAAAAAAQQHGGPAPMDL